MDYSHYTHLSVTRADRVAVVTLNRPEEGNGIGPVMHTELERVWLDLAEDEAVNAIVLTGAGDAFSAGGDLRALAEAAGSEEAFARSLRLPAATRRLLQNLLDVGQPVVVAVNGNCLGLGATLALFSDIVVVAEGAKFGDTHVRVGLSAGDGGTVVWPLLIGPLRAKEFLMRGRPVTGAQAASMGLVNYAVPAAEVLPKAMELAAELAVAPVWAVRWTKLSVNKWLKDQLNLLLDASIAYEMLTMQSRDHGEAMRALLERRQPVFQGR
ncbi:enoyl-CoA hydratase/isomerase family protein [Azospirillum soli]|uniref:enoyl-CoA hydratase/isomerase family protein n=1 Tax=Azospirillum soli TaxID=1304799 RepID=UPI001AEB3A98|nr:enoyl-CoA hydratase-related protein [Azospirillum soli]MBP2316610.1 enoyl-CoA hydratase/carnithine racemase [Azospirillum soli]